MASIVIRNLDESLERNLCIRAAEHGRSIEAEVREILREAVETLAPPTNLGEVIHRRFAALRGVNLNLPPRAPMPDPACVD